MKIFRSRLLIISLTFLSLLLADIGFFYFETSWVLRVLVILLTVIGIWQAKNFPEIITTFSLYLGLYVLYNIRYGLAVPLAIIMVAVFLLIVLLYYFQSLEQNLVSDLDEKLFIVYLMVIGLISLEIFLTMTFWPVDPKTKSLVIIVIFYLYSKLIYLNSHHVLNLKRAIGFISTSVVVLAIVIALSMRLGY